MISEKLLEQMRALGFATTRHAPEKLSLKDLENDRLKFLADDPLTKFHFVRFPDEKVAITSETLSGEIFGTCDYGPLVEAKDGSIRVIAAEDEEVFGALTAFVNSDLDNFLRCYSWFIASLFELRAQFDDLGPAAIRISGAFLDRVQGQDPEAAADGAFWPQMAFLIEELQVQIVTPSVEYARAGRLWKD
ncbi:SUKH-4 family immunity protein [Paracoccus aminophilus]|uniref:SUKH-4 immunity protein n=1 Tax=Paracoccus aminophilus JCM 7686 TaxID=1367847 RepID=S5YXS3_PARAH|nr:SUKH-4 family immunity protein [Paracoccus aminophilus]AGT10001.1 hypothetical protein JCM7686_2965 [Paracoccus aminophilus JCM 7686]